MLHAFFPLPGNFTFELIPDSFCVVGWIVVISNHFPRSIRFLKGVSSSLQEPGTISPVDGLRWNINIFRWSFDQPVVKGDSGHGGNFHFAWLKEN